MHARWHSQARSPSAPAAPQSCSVFVQEKRIFFWQNARNANPRICHGRRNRRAIRRRRGRTGVVPEEAEDDDDVPVTVEADDEVEVDDLA